MKKPIILSLECSTEVCSVCVSQGEKMLSNIENEKGFSHIESITNNISTCLKEASLTLSDLEAVAIGAGPGSYTGLRVATSTAKGLCYGLDIPLIALDSLSILAQAAVGLSNEDDIIVSMIDARRMEVYASIYDHQLNCIEKPHALILDDLSFVKFGNRRILFCGNGVNKYLNNFQCQDFIVVTQATSAKYMVKPAYLHFLENKFVSNEYFSPFYLKSPNITISKKKWF